MFLGICSEKCHYVHDDMCSWPDFPGRNQCGTLKPTVLGACGLWDSLRCEHCDTEGNLQVFKTWNKGLSEWSASPLGCCTCKMEPRKPKCTKNPYGPESNRVFYVLGGGSEKIR